jgi:2-succinyl-5-enolpyruvyl-6-hydroxy-3-cyclohexene-1-carboxylate synthase
MAIDLRNINTIWASVIVETLQRLGVTYGVICPGSRSGVLAVAFAQNSAIEAIPILDERSAAFFALGMAKRLGNPVALVCTSGTAGANFYPAVIEAKESRVPLLILTADRPPELRHCHAGQTIDQVKLYSNYPNWQIELSMPSGDLGMLNYLRQNIIHAYERALFPVGGPVHLNIPFSDPLVPVFQPHNVTIPDDFFVGISRDICLFNAEFILPDSLIEKWQNCDRGIIIAGVANPPNAQEYCQAIALFAQTFGFPVLAEALSPVRNYEAINPHLISTYDLILRHQEIANILEPNMIIQIDELSTSKELRTWLGNLNCHKWVISNTLDNLDPLHNRTTHIRTTIEKITCHLPPRKQVKKSKEYLRKWQELEEQGKDLINREISSIDSICEAKICWILSQKLPQETPVFIANSMSVRYAEFFWVPNNNRIMPYFSRGTNGIDGTLSTALGTAYNHRSGILITGDLALLHDTNGFLLSSDFQGHLTIILINNNGGGIFEMLPIADFDPPFEKFFATPQNIDFKKLCTTYGVEHQIIRNWQELATLLNPLPRRGIRVLELQTNRKEDALWLQSNLPQLAARVFSKWGIT